MKIDATANTLNATVARDRAAAGSGPVQAERNGDLWKACQGFEALFMGHLVKSMEKSLPEGSLSGGGLPDLMFHEVMGTALSEGGGIGLADLLYRNLQAHVSENAEETKPGAAPQDLLTPRIMKVIDDKATAR